MYGAHKFVFSNTLTDGYCQPKMLPFQKKKKRGKKDNGVSKESGKSENDEHHDNCIFMWR